MGAYLGQNFLTDAKVQHYIAEKTKALYESSKADTIIEIGPGKGAITKHIAHIPEHFFVIEKDETLIESGKLVLPRGEIILSDVLQVDFKKIKHITPKKTIVLGNLPYYITSPILRLFFEGEEKSWIGGIFMIQKEVGEKIEKTAQKKSYLWWLINYAYDITYLKTVPAKAFSPAPKVQSCLVWITKKDFVPNIPWENIKEFIDLYAPFSRKTLGAITTMLKKKKNIPYAIPEKISKKRLEELSLEDLQFLKKT